MLSQGSFVPDMNLIPPKTKELIKYHCGCHGNIVTITKGYLADAYYFKEDLYQI